MSVPSWHEESIGTGHDRGAFDCGQPALNDFLRRYARQSHDLGGAKTFVAVDDGNTSRILGFYTVSPGSLLYARTPATVRRGLGRHDVPVFRLARLAVDVSFQGKGLGGQLLLAAGRRCLQVSAEVGGVAMLIDAKDEDAARWYEKFGAIRLEDAALSLLLPLATIAAALTAGSRR